GLEQVTVDCSGIAAHEPRNGLADLVRRAAMRLKNHVPLGGHLAQARVGFDDFHGSNPPTKGSNGSTITSMPGPQVGSLRSFYNSRSVSCKPCRRFGLVCWRRSGIGKNEQFPGTNQKSGARQPGGSPV